MQRVKISSKKQPNFRKRILVGLAVVLCLLILIPVLLLLFLPKKEQLADPNFYFYPVTDENIFENEAYLSLNRTICYCADPNGYGLTEEITEEDLETYDEKVRFLVNYLQTVIAGDASTCRTFFTEAWIASGAVPESFTPQMFYEMKIRYISVVGEGDNARTTYQLDYMIYQNNGTFRRDVGSDAVRPQYVELVKTADGKIAIDRVYTRVYREK